MNMITGYIAATEGTVTINGHDIYEEPQEAKKSIGYLPELPPLYQNMKVREYLLFVAELKGVARSERSPLYCVPDIRRLVSSSIMFRFLSIFGALSELIIW